MSNFSQKILIIVIAITTACGGIWYLQREWLSRDPSKITVDPKIEQKVLTLLEEAKGKSFPVKATIFYKIHGIGQKAIPVIVRSLDAPDAETRAFAANLLQYCGNPSVIPYVEAKLSDEDVTVRKNALTALGGLSAVETVPAIILVLDDEDNFTRCQAAHVLGVLKDDQAVVPLIRLLESDPYPVARQTAANSLGEIGNERAVPPLINALDDRNELVRSASMVALNRITGASLGRRKQAWTDWWREAHLPENPR